MDKVEYRDALEQLVSECPYDEVRPLLSDVYDKVSALTPEPERDTAEVAEAKADAEREHNENQALKERLAKYENPETGDAIPQDKPNVEAVTPPADAQPEQPKNEVQADGALSSNSGTTEPTGANTGNAVDDGGNVVSGGSPSGGTPQANG